MNKSITLLLLVILLCSIGYGVVSQVTSFYGQSNPFNINLNSSRNVSYYIALPTYAYINEVSISAKYADLFNGLVAYYDGEGLNSLTSNYSVNTTGIGTLSLVNGKIGRAYNLTGDYYLQNVSFVSANINTDYTISYWSFCYHNGGSNNPLFNLFTDSDNLLLNQHFGGDNTNEWLLRKSGTNFFDMYGVGTDMRNQWVFTVVRQNSTLFSHWQNATELQTETNITLTGLHNNLNIGFRATSSEYGKCLIDEIGIWSRALTYGEIAVLYNNYTGRNFSEIYYLNYGTSTANYSIARNIFNGSSFPLNTSALNPMLSNCILPNYKSGQNCYLNVTIGTPVGNGTLQVNLTNGSIAYEINNCSGSVIPSNATTLNVSFYDYNNASTNIIYASTTTYYGGTYSLSSPSLNKTRFCVYPNWFNLSTETQFQYTDNAGSIYNYFLNTNFYNVTQLLSLYTQNSTTQVLFTVQDLDETPLINYTIHVLKYDVGTGTYTITEILKTDSNGHTIGNIVLNNAYYNFFVYDTGLNLVLSQTGIRLTSTTYTFTVTGEEDAYYTDASNAIGVNYNLYFNNATENVVFTWSDPAGTMHLACLKVENSTYLGKTTMTDTCTEAASGTIVYNVAQKNDTAYFATGYLKYDYIFPLKTIQFWLDSQREFFSQDRFNSLFMAMILILVGVLVGLPNINFSMIYFIGAVIVTSVLGMWSLTLPLVGSLCILGLIILLIGGK